MFVSPEKKVESINRKSGFDSAQIIVKALRFKSFQTVLSLGEGGMWYKRQGCEQALAAINSLEVVLLAALTCHALVGEK